jgi:hypothetical protein
MITRKAEGKTGQAFIGNMTEEKSVELASKLASESFLFVVGTLMQLPAQRKVQHCGRLHLYSCRLLL